MPAEPRTFNEVWKKTDTGLELIADPSVKVPYLKPEHMTLSSESCERVMLYLDFAPGEGATNPHITFVDREERKLTSQIQIQYWPTLNGYTVNQLEAAYNEWRGRPDKDLLDGLDLLH